VLVAAGSPQRARGGHRGVPRRAPRRDGAGRW